MYNSFGHIFRITTYGESHGKGIGVVVDGCPAGVSITAEEIQLELNRRKPGQSKITTPRSEKDQVEILSGIKDNTTTGTPIGLFVKNEDQKSNDYDEMMQLFRPGHADYTYYKKYGIREEKGGGRSSNRESVARVAAGAIAKKMIQEVHQIETLAWVQKIKTLEAASPLEEVTRSMIESNIVRCPDQNTAEKMIKLIEEAKEAGNSLGGLVQFKISNCPIGLGSPIYKKITAELAAALMSINATRSFSIGLGEDAILKSGIEHNDQFIKENDEIKTKTNKAGGVLGGISNGETIYGTVSFKPTATVLQKQNTVDLKMNEKEFTAKGRHDPCVLPRAVPIVEAMINLVIADHLLLNCLSQLDRIKKCYQ